MLFVSQSLLVSLRATEASMEKFGDDTAELVRSSGEAKLSVNVQQFLSRFLAVQNATKVSFARIYLNDVLI